MDQSTLLENARKIFESDDPAYALEELGITHDHHVTERVIRREGMADRKTIIHHYTWSFPKAIMFEAAFCKEGLVKKFMKLFSKEPQVGDPLFDDNVYVTTSDEDMCMLTLTDRCQGSILNFVQQKGTVEIGGTSVTIVLEDPDVSGYSTEHLEEQYTLVAHVAQWM